MAMNLDGKPLRYLIGGDDDYQGDGDEVTELSYDATRPAAKGKSIKYGNLFDEKNTGEYAPYLEPGDTAEEYNEGQIDPNGEGWNRNLDEQFARALGQGFEAIELDNADSYRMESVLQALDRCAAAGLYTIAKNPMICSGNRVAYVAHDAVIGCIVERDCGAPGQMQRLRESAGKPTLPVWFVAFGAGMQWAQSVAREIEENELVNMGVTYDPSGREYAASTDVLRPSPPDAPSPAPDDKPIVSLRIEADKPTILRLAINANVTIEPQKV